MAVRTRFAPSPTGFVHLGSVYQILFDYAYARGHKGKFLLRVEDTDQKRYTKEAEETIYQAFEWLGISYDEEPVRQSERLEIYQKYAHQLVEQGDAYYCFCSSERLEKLREEQKKKKEKPQYDRACRDIPLEEAKKRISQGEKYVIRMKVPLKREIKVKDLIRGEIVFKSEELDDQVLLKGDGFPTYHLAVVVDDHLMNISHVIRGQEWLPSFPKHVLLYRYFGWEMPIFLHTPVILDPEGGKLSKRKGHTSLFWYKENGFLPEALLNYLALLGWSHPEEKEIFSLKEFIRLFDLKDVSPVSPTFDLTKLEWMNGVYLRQKGDQELVKLLKPFLPDVCEDDLKRVAPLIKERIKTLKEAQELLAFLCQSCDYDSDILVQKKMGLRGTRLALKKIKEIIEENGVKKAKKLQEKFMELIEKRDWKVGEFFMILRVAICGKKITPPITESLALLEKEKVLQQLDFALQKLEDLDETH